MHACSDTAFSAGCGFTIAIAARNPSYEIPQIPTRPLFFATFFTSHSIVS